MSVINLDTTSNNTMDHVSNDKRDTESEEIELLVSTLATENLSK